MSHYYYDLTHFRGWGRNIFVRFLVQMITSKFASEINRPIQPTCLHILINGSNAKLDTQIANGGKSVSKSTDGHNHEEGHDHSTRKHDKQLIRNWMLAIFAMLHSPFPPAANPFRMGLGWRKQFSCSDGSKMDYQPFSLVGLAFFLRRNNRDVLNHNTNPDNTVTSPKIEMVLSIQ